MQRFVAFFASMFFMTGAFFAGIPHTINFWDKPTQSSTDTAKVLSLYKEVAKLNVDTELRERRSADDLLVDNKTAGSFLAEAWAGAAMFLINPRISEIIKGVPGNAAALKASDLQNAKAEFYHKGKTLVITFDLPEQVDQSNGKSSNKAVTNAIGSMSEMSFNSVKVQVARMGYTLKSAYMTYRDAKVMVRVDVASGKIVACEYTYKATISAVINETNSVFQQSFNYTVKKP